MQEKNYNYKNRNMNCKLTKQQCHSKIKYQDYKKTWKYKDKNKIKTKWFHKERMTQVIYKTNLL